MLLLYPLANHGCRIWTQTIPGAITPKNRLLLGAPHQDEKSEEFRKKKIDEAKPG